MPGAEFGAEVRQHGSTGVIDLHGEINLGADQALLAAYESAVQGNPGTVVLNFAHVDYINSTGIALIVGLLARARKEHRTVRAFGLSEHSARSSPSPASATSWASTPTRTAR